MSEQTPATIGPYRVLGKLGEGGAGHVFLATPVEDKTFARRGDLVAIKVYRDWVLEQTAQAERIEREFKAGTTIRHRNVVATYELGKDSNTRPFLVMEYVDGSSLVNWVPMYHPLPIPMLLHILSQITEGLCEVHSQLLHRDLKPSNIMLSEAFTAKIMDLGVVLPKQDKLGRADAVTPSDKFLGTIRNAAPEYLFDSRCDERTDLYSLGTILFFLLHGEEVYAEERQFARLVTRIKTTQPEFDDSLASQDPVHAKLLDLCKRLLSRDPERRPANAREASEILHEMQDAVGPAQPSAIGYIAAALTGLSARNREATIFVGNAIAEACKELNIYAHEPRKATDPVLHKDIPPAAVYLFDRRRIVSSDLVIAVCNEPSFGVGQEIEIAASYGIPTLLVKREGVLLSRMVTGSTTNFVHEPVEYQGPEDLKKKLIRALRPNLEHLRSRRNGDPRPTQARLGEKIRSLRDGLGWSIEHTARKLGISVDALHLFEDNPEHFHNIGLVLLLRMSGVFGVPLSGLIESGEMPTAPPSRIDETNVALIERVACAEGWPAKDLVEIVGEYRQEREALAARGLPLHWAKEDVHRRHEELQRKRLEDPMLFT
jgi:transcriptional regulator with XRE-family HTH domain